MIMDCFQKIESCDEKRLIIHIGGIYLEIKGILEEEFTDNLKDICCVVRGPFKKRISQSLDIIFVDKKNSLLEDVNFNFDFLLNRFPFNKGIVRELNKAKKRWGYILSEIDKKDIIVYPQDNSLFLFDPDSKKAILFMDKSIDNNLISIAILEGLRILLSVSAPHFNATFLHACGIVKDGNGYIFIGFPDSGKSTIAEFSQEDALVLSDDGIIIRRYGYRYRIFGTPYTDILGDTLRKGYILKKIFFIHKYMDTYIKYLSPARASSLILLHYIPYFRFFPVKSAKIIFNIVTDICKSIPIYDLYFNKSKDFLKHI